MKKQFLSIGMSAFTVALFALTSCKKDECHECHYDIDGTIVELGAKCGEELEKLEASGYALNGKVYEVHCHEH